MTIGELEVVHTCSLDEKEIKVYFEEPDDEHFFKTLIVSLHDLRIIKNDHYEPYEVNRLLRFCINNYDAIMEYAKVGGVGYA